MPAYFFLILCVLLLEYEFVESGEWQTQKRLMRRSKVSKA